MAKKNSYYTSTFSNQYIVTAPDPTGKDYVCLQSPKNLTYAREAVIIIWIYMQHFFGEHGKQSAILAPARGARRPPWSPSTVFFKE